MSHPGQPIRPDLITRLNSLDGRARIYHDRIQPIRKSEAVPLRNQTSTVAASRTGDLTHEGASMSFFTQYGRYSGEMLAYVSGGLL